MAMALWHFDLNEDEDLVIDQKPHWIMLVAPTVQLLLLVSLTALGVILLPFLPSWAMLLPLAVFIFLAVRFGTRLGRYKASRLIVTSERLISSGGLLVRRVKEVPIAQISNLSYSQRLGERVLQFGSLQVDHSGESLHDVFNFVRRPERIVRLVSSQISRRSLGSGQTRSHSPLDELSKLATLRRDGSITQDEYEAAKSRLLNQI